MDKCVSSRIENGIIGAIFVEQNFRYIITDDFMITKASTDSVITLMPNFSISDRSRMEKREVLHWLKCFLVSRDKHLLSHTFLNNKETIDRIHPPEEIRSHVPGTQAVAGEISLPTDAIKLKLLVNKFDKKLIHAEANEEFVDFLFNVHCSPVGCIVMLYNGQINLDAFRISTRVLHLGLFNGTSAQLISHLTNPFRHNGKVKADIFLPNLRGSVGVNSSGNFVITSS